MTDFELLVTTYPESNMFRLVLRDSRGVYRGATQVQPESLDRTLWRGLLDSRVFIREKASESIEQTISDLGKILADDILGREIMGALTESESRRCLHIKLPETADDKLAAALARIPWEIARSPSDRSISYTRDLLENNLVISVTTDGVRGRDTQVKKAAKAVRDDEKPLRVLLVFADATHGGTLSWRQEREQLLRDFERDIMRRRNVEVDVLCYGVTRAGLEECIRVSGGYHVIHWSGHGLRDRLELLGEDGQPELITGEDLVDLIRRAGGFIPQLVFLSACLSGAVADIDDMLDSHDRCDGLDGVDSSTDVEDSCVAGEGEIISDSTGFSGTALALLRVGVPQAVAMRYRVTDSFARELACAFYRRLFADRETRAVEDALHLARRDVEKNRVISSRVRTMDRANPIALGHPGRSLVPAEKRSAQLSRLRPRPYPLLPDGNALLERPQRFIGRTRELTRLHRDWLWKSEPSEMATPAVAIIRGEHGIGKSLLAAEALNLWHGRFKWVLAFCAADQALHIEDFYRLFHTRLHEASEGYRVRCRNNVYEQVYLAPSEDPVDRGRSVRMCNNLMEALRDESILLVLDGFQSNLIEKPVGEGKQGYSCADPEWDRLLTELAKSLPDSHSRVLITSTVMPNVYVGGINARQEFDMAPGVTDLELGRFSNDEIKLFVNSYDHLYHLIRSGEDGLQQVRQLILSANGHPQELSRLAELASDPMASAAPTNDPAFRHV